MHMYIYMHIYILSCVITVEQVSPPGTYHRMKLAMLLSLVCSRMVDVFPLNPDLNTSLSLNCYPSQLLVLHYHTVECSNVKTTKIIKHKNFM